MNLRQAAQMALEALEWSWGGEPIGTMERDAITALRAALAEPQTTHWEGCEAVHPECRKPEQVAWMHDENEALRAELAEQARLNGMGSEREARLMALNAELVEALYTAEALLLSMGMKSSDAYQQIDAAITAALNEPVKARKSSGKKNLNVSTTTGSSPT